MDRWMTPEHIVRWREAQQRADDARNKFKIMASPPPPSYLATESLLEWSRLQEEADRMASWHTVGSVRAVRG